MNDLRGQRGQHQRLFRPREDVEEDGVALACGNDVLGGLERPASRGVDRLAVFRQPIAHFLETLDLAKFDFARGHRADVEEQIAVTSAVRISTWRHSVRVFILSSGFHDH